ncbi:MAG: radical SAM protein [Adlercreutzia equolifaciens]
MKRCGYCDFATSAVERDSPIIDEYVESLVMDIRRASREGKLGAIETVYLGGGTPSYIGMRRLSMLLYALSMSMHLEPEVECTMEANPESLTAPMVRDIWALGVNRLSLGVQSFDDEVLRILGRAHDAEAARAAVRAARALRERVGGPDVRIPGRARSPSRKACGRRWPRREPCVGVPADHRTPYALRCRHYAGRDARARRGCGSGGHGGGSAHPEGRGLSPLRGGKLREARVRAATTRPTGRASPTWGWGARPSP